MVNFWPYKYFLVKHSMYYDQDGHNKTYASPTCTVGCFFHPCIRLKTIEQFEQIFYTATFLLLITTSI